MGYQERKRLMNQQSMKEIAYKTIKNKIMTTEYMPGTLLSENELSDVLQMSRTPIRNAIALLESDGYLTTLRNRGVLVKSIDGRELFEYYDAILYMLFYAAEAIMDRELPLDMEQLEQQLHLQLQAQERQDYQDYMKYLFEFYRIVIASIHNKVLLASFDTYTDKLKTAALINHKLTPHIKRYRTSGLSVEIMNALRLENSDMIRDVLRKAYRNAVNQYTGDHHFFS